MDEHTYPTEKGLARFRNECDSLIEYVGHGWTKRVLNRIRTLREFLDALELEYEGEPVPPRPPSLVHLPTTLPAALALSAGNKAKASYHDTLLIVQEVGHMQFRWWTFDEKQAHVWENETGEGQHFPDGASFVEHISHLGLKTGDRIWWPV